MSSTRVAAHCKEVFTNGEQAGIVVCHDFVSPCPEGWGSVLLEEKSRCGVEDGSCLRARWSSGLLAPLSTSTLRTPRWPARRTRTVALGGAVRSTSVAPSMRSTSWTVRLVAPTRCVAKASVVPPRRVATGAAPTWRAAVRIVVSVVWHVAPERRAFPAYAPAAVARCATIPRCVATEPASIWHSTQETAGRVAPPVTSPYASRGFVNALPGRRAATPGRSARRKCSKTPSTVGPVRARAARTRRAPIALRVAAPAAERPVRREPIVALSASRSPVWTCRAVGIIVGLAERSARRVRTVWVAHAPA